MRDNQFRMRITCSIMFVTVVVAMALWYVVLMTNNLIKSGKISLDDFNVGRDILFHDTWIEMFGLTQRLLGKHQIENFTIYKLDYGKLVTTQDFLSNDEIERKFEDMYPIVATCNERKIPCYYVTSVLSIQDADDLPFGAIEGSHLNKALLLKMVDDKNIRIIDIENANTISRIPKKNLFYKSDHHWRIETCFAAYQEIIRTISDENEWNLKAEVTADVSNYELLKHKDAFLGSLGVKVGRWYVGKDDFNVYIPEFPTKMTFQSYNAEGHLLLEKTGDFQEALLDDVLIEDPEYDNKYNAFCNQGYIENRIINGLASNELKCLYISHSYGRPMTMYLSLNFAEIRNLDPQEGRFRGNYLSYINEYKPDVVIIQTEYEGKIVGEYDTSDDTE